MKLHAVIFITLAFACLSNGEGNADDNWSWVTGPGGQDQKPDEKPGSTAAPSVDAVVDNILQSNRQGRNLDEFREVYTDPNVIRALEGGNDTTARHYIKERLCNLGLMACEDEIVAKRGSVSPHDVIYAQPIALKPVGHPIPAVPVRGPHHLKPVHVGPYGPPRPVPVPGKYGPPHGPVYRPPRPHGPKPYPVYEKPGSFEEITGPGIIDHELPPFLEPSHHKVHTDKSTVVVNAQGGSSGPGGVQQHVHHHYHHGTGPSGPSVTGPQKPIVVERPVIVEKPVPVPTPVHVTSSIHGSRPAPVFESGPSASGFGGSYNGINGGSHGYYGSGSGGSYINSSPFYKKQLNLNSNSQSGASYASEFSSYHTPRADGQNCVCVPVEQCPAYNIITRKDEGLGIDPRSNPNGADIQAFSLDDVVITDGNGTIISHHAKSTTKREDTDAEAEKDDETKSESRRKRDVPDKNENGEDKKEVQPRLLNGGLGAELSKLKVSPTFGVSFGLPQSGSYPINPHTGTPVINPYGHSIGPDGVKLGPVSVNPLLAVQVSKDEFGEKIVKPFVNLHVTPTHGLIHKIGGIKHKLLHNLAHGHHDNIYHYAKPYIHYEKPYIHYEKPYIRYEKPHIHYEKPDIHHYKPGTHSDGPHYPYHHYSKPFNKYPLQYASNYDNYDLYQTDYEPHGDYYSNNGYSPYDYGDYYDDYSYKHDDYYRNAKSLNITARPTSSNIQAYPKSSISESSSQQPSNSNKPSSNRVSFPRYKRDAPGKSLDKRQAYYDGSARCGPRYVCCRRQPRPVYNHRAQCGRRNAQGINGRIKTPSYVEGESEFGEYPWQVAILKKDPQESVYVCGGTLIDNQHIITAAHCVKTYSPYDLRVRLGEWDVNHDVEFYPYVERDVSLLQIHPEFYAGTLQNDIAILRMDRPVDVISNPHISAACLPEPHAEYAGSRCWTTGWGKDAFGDYGKYQNVLKEVDVPVISHNHCQTLLQQTRLGYDFKLHPGFVCAGGEEGKDACKGDGGGPMVCERGGSWQVVGIVSWGVGCGQHGVPGVYVKVAHYLDWIRQITNRY